ncbi:MAG: carbohydrate kinase family protein [Clostridia bacterium]|nr:carbohydrate kinase family protein [Clostridia bacterium]
MSRILISGLVNTETTVRVRGFPVEYYPIDYPFFGVNTAVAGVGYNLTKALRTLGDDVTLLSMTGDDFAASYIRSEMEALGVGAAHIRRSLSQTPSSVVLYDEQGRRQIYCDLKDIQDTPYDFGDAPLDSADLVVACNINYNRPLLHAARVAGKTIATDVHVLRDIYDDYNSEFMACADILFLSDEGVGDGYEDFMRELARVYGSRIIVMGRGAKGAAIYTKDSGCVAALPAEHVGGTVNTVGAGDALFSAFLHGYAGGMEPIRALRRAQLFAAAKIRVSGAAQGFITEAGLDALERR